MQWEESRDKAKKEQDLKEFYELVKELEFYPGHYILPWKPKSETLGTSPGRFELSDRL